MTLRRSDTWPSPKDRDWGDRLLFSLTMTHSVPAAVAAEAVGEAREACRETERAAAELFGDADAYAREVARDRVPVEERAGVDLEGGTPRDRWMLLLLTAGSSLGILSVMLLFGSGWTVEVGPAHAVLFSGVLAAWIGAHWGMLERRAGRLRRGWQWWVGSVAGVVVASTGAVLLKGRDPLFEFPVVALLLLSIALVVLGARRKPRPVPVGDVSRTLSPDAWFGHLGGLLRGRYYLPRESVRRHVADARGHWRDSGASHPQDEFGPPEVYALELLDGSSEPERGRGLGAAWFYTVMTAFSGFNVASSAIESEDVWGVVWRGAALLVFAALAAGAWRGHVSRSRTRSARALRP